MNFTGRSQFLRRFGLSGLGLTGFVFVLLGIFLSASVHIGFFALVGVGAFGPSALRQFGLVRDLDEFQKEAVVRAAHRAYLITGLFLTVVVIARQWGTRRFGDDLVPASLVLILCLVVYGGSYALSFWDAPKAALLLLFTIGFFWLVFAILSHGNHPLTAVIEGTAVAGPFIASALLSRKWPRVAGLILIVLSIGALFFFHLIPLRPIPATRLFAQLFVVILIPVPMAAVGLALMGRGADSQKPSAQ
jgi:hypothetical protein